MLQQAGPPGGDSNMVAVTQWLAALEAVVQNQGQQLMAMEGNLATLD